MINWIRTQDDLPRVDHAFDWGDWVLVYDGETTDWTCGCRMWDDYTESEWSWISEDGRVLYNVTHWVRVTLPR